MNDLGNADKQGVGRWANNRAENAHLSFRRREQAMLRFRRMKSLQKFALVPCSIITTSIRNVILPTETFKERRSAALAEWNSLVS